MKHVMRYKIAGWGGEHDETGASIVDTKTGIAICHTASESGFRNWSDYTDNAEDIVHALNLLDRSRNKC